jgi:3-hydroxymyristoyl/3-hydroxydecanoyl-(acyl carrier protein) dehydratase
MNEEKQTANNPGRRQWHRVTLLPESASGELQATAETHPTSPWYSGHFPGEPILPGIAQIAMVLETIHKARGHDLCITGIKRVRFKQVIQPADDIAIRVRPREGDPNAYGFQVTVGEEIACSGILVVAPVGDG